MIPAFLSELVRTVVVMTITGSVLCLFLLVMKPLVRHRLPKSAQYYFWMVVLGALLVPISRIVVLSDTSRNPVPIHSIVEQNVISSAENYARLNVQIIEMNSQDASQIFTPVGPRQEITIESPARISLFVGISTMFMSVYLWAVLFVLAFSLVGYSRFLRKLRRGYISLQDYELDTLLSLSQGKRVPQLVKSTNAATPMFIGIFNPIVVLPSREYSTEQLHSILLHELTHLHRFDVAVKWISLIACAVHWFNPLVWVARREIDRACELACDEAVIHNMDACNKQYYGETLLAVAGTNKISLSVISTTMCAETLALKERLVAIMKNKKHAKSAVLVSALILFASILTAFTLGVARGGYNAGSESDVFDNNIATTQYPEEIPINLKHLGRILSQFDTIYSAGGDPRIVNSDHGRVIRFDYRECLFFPVLPKGNAYVATLFLRMIATPESRNITLIINDANPIEGTLWFEDNPHTPHVYEYEYTVIFEVFAHEPIHRMDFAFDQVHIIDVAGMEFNIFPALMSSDEWVNNHPWSEEFNENIMPVFRNPFYVFFADLRQSENLMQHDCYPDSTFITVCLFEDGFPIDALASFFADAFFTEGVSQWITFDAVISSDDSLVEGSASDSSWTSISKAGVASDETSYPRVARYAIATESVSITFCGFVMLSSA
jgi:beta-lactamase regulating signal transducer with metallopeptidase domain